MALDTVELEEEQGTGCELLLAILPRMERTQMNSPQCCLAANSPGSTRDLECKCGILHAVTWIMCESNVIILLCDGVLRRWPLARNETGEIVNVITPIVRSVV